MNTDIQNQNKPMTYLYAENHRLGFVVYNREEDRWTFPTMTVREVISTFTKTDIIALSESPRGLALARCTAKYMAAPQNQDAIVDVLTGRIGRDAPAVYAINHALRDCRLGVTNANGFTVKEVGLTTDRILCYEGNPICRLLSRDSGYRTDHPISEVVDACFYFPGILTKTFEWVRTTCLEPRDTDTIKDLVRFYMVQVIDDLAEQGDDCHEDDGFTVEEE